jgi:hypothetical protein
MMNESFEANCGRCGYVLRGLPAGSHCPECALPTDFSLGQHALHETQRNDRVWTRQLRTGVRILLAGQMILVISLLGSFANDLVRFTIRPFFLWILPIVVLIGALGAWMVSTPTLFSQCDRWWNWVRRTMRGVALSTALSGILIWLNEFRAFVDWVYPLMVMMILWSAAIALTFAYLSASAEQIGSMRLATVSRRVMWSLPIGIVAPPVIGLFTWMNVRPFSATPTVVVSAILCALWFVGSYSTAVTVLVRLRRAIDNLVLQRSLAGMA